MIRVYTNVIVRYIVDDIKELADILQEILENQKVFISNELWQR